MVRIKRSRNRRAQLSSRSLQQPSLWVVLSVALLVIGLTVITSLGPSSVTGNTVQTISYMREGDSLHLAVRDVPGLETIFTHADEVIKSGKIVAEVDDSILFNRPYLSKFKVSSESKFRPLQFTFKVREQDMLDKGISRYDLRLYHGVKEYPLQLLKVNHGSLYYIVTVPDMGNFVLGRVDVVEKKVVAEEETVVEAPVAEEQPVEEMEEKSVEAPVEVSEEALVGKAVESSPGPEQKGFFARIAEFFKNLFS